MVLRREMYPQFLFFGPPQAPLKKYAFLNWTGLGKTHIFLSPKLEKNWENRDFCHVLAPEKEN